MKETLAEKIVRMLMVYRYKLEKASTPLIDFVEGIRLNAIISVLENLDWYAKHEVK